MKHYEDLDLLNQLGKQCIMGVDEVGRGPLAGPVVSCAVLIKNPTAQFMNELLRHGVTDSKKLSDQKRRTMLETLGIDPGQLVSGILCETSSALTYALSEVGPREIEATNILRAALHSMDQAISLHIPSAETLIVVDGNRKSEMMKNNNNIVTAVKGDMRFLTVGLASIIAKVYRDDLMNSAHEKFPEYEFGNNAGYGTAKHLAAIKTYGVTELHRLTFAGVKEYV